MNAQVIAAATRSIKDPGFKYDPSTNVANTLKRHGWSEPDRQKQRAMKLLLNGVDLAAILDAAEVA